MPVRLRDRVAAGWLPSIVVVLLLATTVASFVVSRRVADDQERRLLANRAREAEVLLLSSFGRTETALQMLAALANGERGALQQRFSEAAQPLRVRGTETIGLLTRTPQGYVQSALVGDGTAIGAPVTGPLAALAERARDPRRVVAEVVNGTTERRAIIALAADPAGRRVVFQESVLPAGPIPPRNQYSPFGELRIAIYASDVADPARLVLTTESQVPLQGEVRREPFPVGSETWLLGVSAREPLIGPFARRVPWLLLGAGLVTTMIAAAGAQVLRRRRDFALQLVDARTRELRQAHGFVERSMNSAPVVVRRVAADSRCNSYVSPNVAQIFGVAGDELMERDAVHPVHPEDRARVIAALTRVTDGSVAREVVEYRARFDGGYRWVSTVIVPDPEDEGDPHRSAATSGPVGAVLCYDIDIDARRRAEEAQNEAQLAADAANRSKSEFLSRMSHELRTPLNAVLGFGQLLQMERLNDDQHDWADQIVTGGGHLLSLIDEVLDISRIEAGDLALSPEPVLVADLLDEVVKLVRPLGLAQAVHVLHDASGSDRGCYVLADRQRIKQALLNLLSNAIKYNRPRGTVVVRCERPSPLVATISVQDTGFGIAEDAMARLFVPFERLGAENTKIEGTGIGLALTLRLVEAMSGSLTVASDVGRGSTFSIALPVVEGPINRYERLHAGSAVEPQPAPAARAKLLLIEDNLANVQLVEHVVAATRPEIEVVPSMYGGLGLELAREHQPFVVVLDLHLPDMSGEQVLQRLRDDPATASIPVLIASADASPGQVRRLLAAGAAAYVTKPLDVREFVSLLDRHLPARV